MDYLNYFIVIIILLVYLLIFILKYNTNIINNYIKNKYLPKIVDNNINNDFSVKYTILQGTVVEGMLERVMNGIQYLDNETTFIFLNNIKKNDVITYGGYNSVLEYPFSNMSNDSTEWIYGGYFIISNNAEDYICVRGNDNKIERLNDDKNIINYITDETMKSNVIYTNIMYDSEEIFLVNIKLTHDDPLSQEFVLNFNKILLDLNTSVLNDKKFIISGESNLNSKFINASVKNIFSNSVISSCYTNVVTNTYNNKFVQSAFIIIKKDLCPNGVRFSIKYLEDEISNYNFLLLAYVYNNMNNIYYYDDEISLNIFNDISANDNFTDEYINWKNISNPSLSSRFNLTKNQLMENKNQLIENNNNNNPKYIRKSFDDIIKQLI